MKTPRVAIIAGGRTPFVKSGKAFKDLGPLALAKHAVVRLLETHAVDPSIIEAIVFGAVVAEPGKPNLAREIVFEAGLPSHIEAQTISSYCITGLRTVTAVAEAIATGRIEVGIAGGVEWLSGANPDTFREPSTGVVHGRAHRDNATGVEDPSSTPGRNCAGKPPERDRRARDAGSGSFSAP